MELDGCGVCDYSREPAVFCLITVILVEIGRDSWISREGSGFHEAIARVVDPGLF